MTSTFWGLRLEAGKRYSTIVDKSFHVSMAALDCTTVKSEKEVHSVMLEEGESNIPFILCNLHKPKVTQCPLNLNFVSGDRVTFFCRGNGTVHLTGYLMLEEDDEFGGFGEEGEEVEEEEDEDEEEEEGVDDEDLENMKGKSKVNGLLGKRKADQVKGNQKKQPKLEESEQDEAESASDLDSEDNALIGQDESEEDEPETDEESEEEPESQQQLKKNKKQKTQPQSSSQQKLSPSQLKQANGALQQKKKQGNEEKPAAAAAASGKKSLTGGVVVKDLKLGTGPVCKQGKMVSVYYVGRLKSNNKVFDKLTQGKGFKFRLGKEEVIKGWDIGLAGMKVGGKRLITCPPNMAYGDNGSPPTIPPKSTLIFEVELKSVF